MYLDTGIINIQSEKLPNEVLKYLYKVFKKAKVDYIDVYYQEDMFLYIGAESLNTNMVSFYKINLNENTSSGKLTIEEDADFDLDELNMFDDDIMSSIDVIKPANNIVEKPIIKFGTILNFLNCLTVSHNPVITVANKTILVRTDKSQFTLPTVPSSMTIEKYLEMMNIDAMAQKWEKVNVDGIKAIASAVSAVRVKDSDMFVGLQGNSIYSNNIGTIFETNSWNIKSTYTFNYSTIEALRSIPNNYSVQVAKDKGRLMLKIEDIYFGWDDLMDLAANNIMSLLNLSKFVNVMSFNKKQLYAFGVMEGFSTEDSDDTIELTVVSEGTIQLKQNDNVMLINGTGKVGSSISIYDSKSFVQLIRLSDSDSPTISIDPDLKGNKVALIEGSIKILTSIKDFKL